MEYTKEELLEAKRQIDSTIHKLRSTILALQGKENPARYKSQITLAQRRVKAFEIAVGLDVLCCAPPGGAVFHVLAELFGILALHIDPQPHGGSDDNANAEIYRVEAGQRNRKGGGQPLHEVQELSGEISTGSQPCRPPQLSAEQGDENIGQVRQQDFLPVYLLHRSSSFFFVRSTTADWTSALNCSSLARTEGRDFLFTICSVYSLKAAVMASAS